MHTVLKTFPTAMRRFVPGMAVSETDMDHGPAQFESLIALGYIGADPAPPVPEPAPQAA